MNTSVATDKSLRLPIARLKPVLHKYGIVLTFLFICATIAVLGEICIHNGMWDSNYFLTQGNFLSILRQVSINGILAVGMTFVIIVAGVDLSVGSVLALAGIVAARFVTNSSNMLIGGFDSPILLPLMVAICIGAICGFLNGYIISKFRLQAFIVTMGMLSVARGMTMLTTDGNPVSSLDRGFRTLGNSYTLGIPTPVVIFAVIFIAAWFLLNKTVFGRYVFAVGGNEKSAQTSGIDVHKVKVAVYTLCGVTAAIAGLILTARTGSAQTSAGFGYELDAIAAVVIGGTSMAGGLGTLTGTLFGVLIIGVMNNGLDLLGVQSYYQQIIKGLLIVAAVMLDPSRKQSR
ncbi:ABC transporter permease [Shewanella sp. 0m-11]